MPMTENALKFSSEDILGCVAGVDTHRISISIDNPSLVTRIGVGEIIALKGSTEQDFLIAIVERVLRSLAQSLPDLNGAEEELPIEISPVDSVRATLIGTYRTVEGSKSNTFKRGADSFPQIDREAYIIEAGNLQRFMGLLLMATRPFDRKTKTLTRNVTGVSVATRELFCETPTSSFLRCVRDFKIFLT